MYCVAIYVLYAREIRLIASDKLHFIIREQ